MLLRLVMFGLIMFLTATPGRAQEATGETPLAVRNVPATERLNLREWANPKATTLLEIPRDAVGLMPTGRTHGQGTEAWIEVVYQGKRGWVSATFVGPEKKPDQKTSSPDSPYTSGDILRVTGAATDDKLNLRAEPSAQSAIVHELPAQASDIVASGESRRNGDVVWIKVEYDGKLGWVNSRFVKPAKKGPQQEPQRPAAVMPSRPQDADPIQACDSTDAQKRLVGCTALLKRADLTRSARAIAYSRRADSHLQQNNYALAIADISEAEKLEPNYQPHRQRLASAYYMRGLTGSRDKKFANAIDDYSKAIQADPHFEPAFGARVRTYVEMGDSDKAIDDLKNALRFDSTNEVRRHELAELCTRRAAERLSRDDVSGAIEDYSQAIDLLRENVSLYLARANLYLLQNNSSAAEDADKVLAVSPEHMEAHEIRGYARMISKDYVGALDDFSFVIKRQKRPRAALYLARAQAYERLSYFDAAQADYKWALKVQPHHAAGNAAYARLLKLRRELGR